MNISIGSSSDVAVASSTVAPCRCAHHDSTPLSGGADDRGEAALGSIGKFASASEKNALSRFHVLHKMRKNSNIIHVKHEVFSCHCCKIPSYRTDKETGHKVKNEGVPEHIEIHSYQKGAEQDGATHSFVGLKRCASAMVCPVCGSVIRHKRKEELIEIGEKLIGAGYSYFFVTYTASHQLHTSLADFVLRFQAAQRDLKSGRYWQKLKKKYGLRFESRTVEVTDDNPLYEGPARKTGWHFHSHSIMWVEKPITEEEKEALRKELARLWVRCCFGVGLQASTERGCVVDFPHTKNGDVADVKPLAQYLAKKISYELTSDIYKDGRLSRRVSIWELLRIAAESNDPKLWARWGEYMKGIKGVNFLRLTPGLRAFCGIEEKTDAELLEGATEKLVYTFADEDWSLVVAQGAQRKLLYIVDLAVKDGRDIHAAIGEALYYARLGFDVLTGEQLMKGEENFLQTYE